MVAYEVIGGTCAEFWLGVGMLVVSTAVVLFAMHKCK